MLTEEKETTRKKKSEIVVQAPYRRIEHIVENKQPKLSKGKWFLKATSRVIYNFFFNSILHYFMSVNRKVGSKIAFWYMKCETLEHVDLLIKVFKWVVLPASLFYLFSNFYFFGENALDSMLLGILIFLYSNFLPDLPSIFRRKVNSDVRDTWYKKYAFLLFAPLFIGALFCGIRPRWKTAENFHNFKSLTIYEAFIFMLSFLAFSDLPIISIVDITEILSLPLYAMVGYLTHLKVDLCF